MPSKIKPKTTKKTSSSIVKVKKIGSITEYRIPANGLTILYSHRAGTGVITTDITYKAGSRDEEVGATGVAHMLEHMLFKPTKYDLKRKTDSAAMLFEREVGCMLNATTWKDRTTYYFSYPKEHFERALKIEAERMRDVILTDKEFLPERTNVLSEYDMNAGDEEFLLAVPMVGTALHSHPYRHETIGFREDIEAYTIEKLQSFYTKYYAPNNATLIVVGDVNEDVMLNVVEKNFAKLKPSATLTARKHVVEPKQEGLRTVEVHKPSTTNMLALGVRHEGFPTIAWFETMVAFEIIAGGKDSILHKKLVDTAKASKVHGSIEPTYDVNIGILFITLVPAMTHAEMYTLVRECIDSLTIKDVSPYLKKVIAKSLTHEFTNRENSFGFVAELLEYVSAGAWEHFFETENILKRLTAKAVLSRIKLLFAENQLTVGKFIGK